MLEKPRGRTSSPKTRAAAVPQCAPAVRGGRQVSVRFFLRRRRPRPPRSPAAPISVREEKLVRKSRLKLRRGPWAPAIAAVIPAVQSKENVAVVTAPLPRGHLRGRSFSPLVTFRRKILAMCNPGKSPDLLRNLRGRMCDITTAGGWSVGEPQCRTKALDVGPQSRVSPCRWQDWRRAVSRVRV